MTTLLVTHSACLDHDTSPGHPESPARLRAVLKALDAPDFDALQRIEAPRATREQLLLVHPEAHVDKVFAEVPEHGYGRIDADTIVSPGSGEAALRAAGALVAAVDAVMDGSADNAFCAVRPPGHHAEPMRAMGFCLFNNVAIGALHAMRQHRLDRIAVMDFDVHHGNGTQALFEHEAELFYASTHQSPLYPGTGSLSERGIAGNIVNAPLPPGAGSDAFRDAMRSVVLPSMRKFAPEMVFISAGFDAHAADPLAQLSLTVDDFAWATSELCRLADDLCEGRVVSTLEGGYDLAALAASSAAHVRALMAAA
ncbi:MAG: histone deacetylase family protein [Alphaproteobacteria bacterium]|jgi:acetoin utilization deacetylase AcuC-like enzyme